MKKYIIKILKIVIPLGIGIYLTWFFYSGLTQGQKDAIPVAFASANYFWIMLALITAWLGHVSRAYRWKFLMEPLGYKPKLSNMYHATMIGYVLNFTIPRSGEIARPGFLAKKENLPLKVLMAIQSCTLAYDCHTRLEIQTKLCFAHKEFFDCYLKNSDFSSILTSSSN